MDFLDSRPNLEVDVQDCREELAQKSGRLLISECGL